MVASYASPADAPDARAWAAALGVRCVDAGRTPGVDLSLVMDGGVLSLHDHRGRGLKPLSIELDAPASPSKKQPLGRAVGRRTRSVVDATAGWGDDAGRLAAMGYSVTMLERNPIMAALLRNAVDRAAGRSGGARLQMIECDAVEYLGARADAWDCVYLDPMFPPKRRTSTLAKRPLRLLRELAGDDPDSDRMFEAAMRAAGKRVVVKRPDHAAPLFGKPAETVTGKLVRYDVYFRA